MASTNLIKQKQKLDKPHNIKYWIFTENLQLYSQSARVLLVSQPASQLVS